MSKAMRKGQNMSRDRRRNMESLANSSRRDPQSIFAPVFRLAKFAVRTQKATVETHTLCWIDVVCLA